MRDSHLWEGEGRTMQRAIRSICLFNHPWQHWLSAPLKIHNITETLLAPGCSDQMQGGTAAASAAAQCGRRACAWGISRGMRLKPCVAAVSGLRPWLDTYMCGS